MLTQIFQLLLSLSFLIFFHELGHFAFAKLFKTRVEQFYLFFNPWFSIFKFKKGDTEYGLGWLPLGGYVKIAGMIDESLDKAQMRSKPKPWEFRSKPAWQRLLIMLGGVLVNFLLAFIIYIGILAVWGEDKIPVKEVNKFGIAVDSIGRNIGLETGDKLISVNGENIDNVGDIVADFLLNSPHSLIVEREGKEVEITLSDDELAPIINSKKPFFHFRHPFVINNFADTSVAKDAGMKINDKVIAVNGKPMCLYDEVGPAIYKYRGDTLPITVLRNEKDTLFFAIALPESGKLGVEINSSISKYFVTEEKSIAEAIPSGINKTFKEIGNYFAQLKLITKPKTGAYKSLGSFISIGNLFSKTWNWEHFWRMTALLSIVLGVMNLLPIPALDGGHVMFTLYEMIIGRKPSDKFLEVAQIVGMVILLLLFVFAIGNDFIRYVF